MTILTKNDVIDWKTHVVTRLLKEVVQERIKEAQEVLGSSAGMEPLADRLIVGMIRAYQELLEWTPEFQEEQEDDIKS
jgi:hypothetical protein